METIRPERVVCEGDNTTLQFTCKECGGHDLRFEHEWLEVSPYTELHGGMNSIREGQEILAREGRSYSRMTEGGTIDQSGRLIYEPLDCTHVERRPDRIITWEEDEFPAGEADHSRTQVKDESFGIECANCHALVPIDWTAEGQVTLSDEWVFDKMPRPASSRADQAADCLSRLGYDEQHVRSAVAALTGDVDGIADGLLNAKQLAKALGVAESTIHRTKPPCQWVGKRRKYRLQEVLNFMQQRQSRRPQQAAHQ